MLEKILKQSLGDGAVDFVVVGGLRLQARGGLGDLVFSDFGKLLDERNQPCDLGGLLRLGRDVDRVGPLRRFGASPAVIFLARLV